MNHKNPIVKPKKTPRKNKSKIESKQKKTTPQKGNQKSKSSIEKKKNTTIEPVKQILNKPLKDFPNFFETIRKDDRARFNIKDRAKTSARGIINQAQAIQRSIGPKKESRVKHVFVLYSKITFALVCCVFLFIGAPMGAIVRKGGFGYPLLISILFFMLFIILNILFQKLAESYVLEAEIAVWCPLLILTPIGIILTKRAMEDKKVLNTDRITSAITKIINSLKKRNPAT